VLVIVLALGSIPALAVTTLVEAARARRFDDAQK
jgi:hypothetical protein